MKAAIFKSLNGVKVNPLRGEHINRRTLSDAEWNKIKAPSQFVTGSYLKTKSPVFYEAGAGFDDVEFEVKVAECPQELRKYAHRFHQSIMIENR